jgi:paraquat-inducible protein B
MEFPDSENSIATMRESVEIGVTNGLRATMASGNLLTGAKYISFDFFPGAKAASLGSFMEYTTIPTMDSGLAQLDQKVNALLDNVNALPLADTVTSANTAIASLNQNLASLQSILENQSTQQLPASLNETLQELRKAVDNLSPDSQAGQSLNSSLLSLNRTLGNLESLTRKLSGQPNAVLLPSTPTPDPIPEVSK